MAHPWLLALTCTRHGLSHGCAIASEISIHLSCWWTIMVCVNSPYWLGRSESKRRPGALACKKRLKDARARQSNQAFCVIEQAPCFFWLVGSVPSDESTRATD